MTMTSGSHDLRRRLREADPLAVEPAPSADTLARVRRAVLDAAQSPPSRARHYATLALAAMLTVAAALGAVAARQFAGIRDDAAVPLLAPSNDAGERTQVQFSTPGGTRIIWTIDPAFRLREAP